MKLKFIALYTCFFILIFIIFSFLNFFYKSTISISDKVYNYTISAEQYFDFKNQSLSKVLYRYFSKGKNISPKKLQNLYRIENKKIINSSYTLNKAKSTFSANLISRNYLDENEFEESINKIYLDPIKEILTDIESNNKMYNFTAIKKNYAKKINNKIIVAYDNLINSKFFTNYPPDKICNYIDVIICYDIYSKYYLNLYFSLKDTKLSKSVLSKLNVTKDKMENKYLIDVLEDFNENRYLFDNYNSGLTDYNKRETIYFEENYNKLINSDFFREYMPTSYCLNYSQTCFENLEIYFNKILLQHKLESELPFNIIYNIPKKNNFNLINETPLILGISITVTYIFFIFTKRFFRRKLK